MQSMETHLQHAVVLKVNVIDSVRALETQSTTLLLVLDQLIALDTDLVKVVVGANVEVEELLDLDGVAVEALFAPFFELEHL